MGPDLRAQTKARPTFNAANISPKLVALSPLCIRLNNWTIFYSSIRPFSLFFQFLAENFLTSLALLASFVQIPPFLLFSQKMNCKCLVGRQSWVEGKFSPESSCSVAGSDGRCRKTSGLTRAGTGLGPSL